MDRQSVRLLDFDYAASGCYFVTLCAVQRRCLFGEVRGGEVRLNQIGEIVRGEWLRTPEVRPEIILDDFVVMPNHLHGIVVIRKPEIVGASAAADRAPLQATPERYADTRPHLIRPARSLASFIAGFKAFTTKRINEIRRSPGHPLWQRNYYEHVIRDDQELGAVRDYIFRNPQNWMRDRENPLAADYESTTPWEPTADEG